MKRLMDFILYRIVCVNLLVYDFLGTVGRKVLFAGDFVVSHCWNNKAYSSSGVIHVSIESGNNMPMEVINSPSGSFAVIDAVIVSIGLRAYVRGGFGFLAEPN